MEFDTTESYSLEGLRAEVAAVEHELERARLTHRLRKMRQEIAEYEGDPTVGRRFEINSPLVVDRSEWLPGQRVGDVKCYPR